MKASQKSPSQSELGPFNYILTDSQFSDALVKIFWTIQSRSPWKWIYVGMAAVCVALIVGDLADGYLNLASTAVALLTVPVTVGLLRWQTGWSARRMFARTPDLRNQTSLTICGDDLLFESATSRQRQPMGELDGWLETASLILVERPDQRAFIIPKRAIGPDIEAVLDRFEKAGVRRL